MAGEKIDFDEAQDGANTASSERGYERSTIQFPYLDLDTAVEVARALYDRAGHGACGLDELAAQMGQTVSGAFRAKTATARMYGLTEKDGRSEWKLTDLGRAIVQPEREPSARVEAFLTIPLYSAIYENYKGHLLPPPKALEREMVSLGVASKQADKARQVFERSAQQAGFFAHGDDRLVQPRIDKAPATKPVQKEPPQRPGGQPPSGGGGQGGGPTAEKPLRYQLIDLLDPDQMSDQEQQAVFTLINYLARQKTKGSDDSRRAEGQETTAAEDDDPTAAA